MGRSSFIKAKHDMLMKEAKSLSVFNVCYIIFLNDSDHFYDQILFNMRKKKELKPHLCQPAQKGEKSWRARGR